MTPVTVEALRKILEKHGLVLRRKIGAAPAKQPPEYIVTEALNKLFEKGYTK